EPEALHRDVEVEIVDAPAILHRVDHAETGLDADGAEILDEWHVVRLKGRLVDQELDIDALARRADALAVLDGEACLLKQLRSLAQERAVLARAVGHRRHEWLAEHLVRDVAAERLQQF